MQIGVFAELCKTKLSVLRHYDKEGLLIPAYIDPMTGYRHYTAEQAAIFRRITALKQAGFSLGEIRRVLLSADSDEGILSLFDAQEARLTKMLSDLALARTMMMEETMQFQITITEENGKMTAVSVYFDAAEAAENRHRMDTELRRTRYQRISGYRVQRDGGSRNVRLSCEVLRLNETSVLRFEDTDLPFTDDPLIVGRWDVIGEFWHRSDVPACPADAAGAADSFDEHVKSLYFLPGGEMYWCYGWTRGKLLCRYGDSSYVCDYTTECIGGQRFMFVDWKSYEYRYGGRPVVLVLRQYDTRAYTKEELARKDDIDLPYTDDPQVLGAWMAVDIVSSPEAFDPTKPERQNLFFSRVTFLGGGAVESVYGDQVIAGAHMQVWTRGAVLRKWNSTACAYEIRRFDGVEFLFIEWKSGDYIWGGREPKWYVFRRM